MLKALLQTQLYVLYVTFSTNNVSFFLIITCVDCFKFDLS